jgi:hypothetical protein
MESSMFGFQFMFIIVKDILGQKAGFIETPDQDE